MAHSPGIRSRIPHVGEKLLPPNRGIPPAGVSKGIMHLDARRGACGRTVSRVIVAVLPSVFCVLQAGCGSTVQAVVFSMVLAFPLAISAGRPLGVFLLSGHSTAIRKFTNFATPTLRQLAIVSMKGNPWIIRTRQLSRSGHLGQAHFEMQLGQRIRVPLTTRVGGASSLGVRACSWFRKKQSQKIS